MLKLQIYNRYRKLNIVNLIFFYFKIHHPFLVHLMPKAFSTVIHRVMHRRQEVGVLQELIHNIHTNKYI